MQRRHPRGSRARRRRAGRRRGRPGRGHARTRVVVDRRAGGERRGVGQRAGRLRPVAGQARRRTPRDDSRPSGSKRWASSSSGPVEPTGNGVIVSLVERDGERSMFPDRGVATRLEPGELRPAWLTCDHLHVSGYALLAEPVVRAAIRAIDLARLAGARVSIDLSSWSAIRDAGAERFRALVESLEPDVVFANEAENEMFGGPLPGTPWILKRGARGCSFDGDDRRGARGPGGRRHDRGRRRPRRGLDRGRARPRARGCSAVRPAHRADAVTSPGRLRRRTVRSTARGSARQVTRTCREIGTKTAHPRHTILDSVISGTPGCPWGRLGGRGAPGRTAAPRRRDDTAIAAIPVVPTRPMRRALRRSPDARTRSPAPVARGRCL